MVDSMNRLFDVLYKAVDSLGLSPPYLAILGACLIGIFIGPWVRIFRRAGFHPGLGFLMFIPVINALVFLLFAFFEWPIEKENRRHDESSLFRM